MKVTDSHPLHNAEEARPNRHYAWVKLPSERVLNSHLGRPDGTEVVMIEVLDVRPGNVVLVRFQGVSSPWRQGVWLATDGLLEIGGERTPQAVLWADTAPEEVRVEVVQTDGLLRFYNVWDSGRGLGPHESQSASSGMLVDGGVYRCSDIALEPQFDRLTFSVAVTT